MDYFVQYLELQRKLKLLQRKLKLATDILKEMEWSGFHTDYEDSWSVMTIACPYCMNAKSDGHKPDCKLNGIISDDA
jgi:hypothetical protein